VDLTRPELTVFVEILPGEAYVYFEKVPGPGGLPVGIGGRVVVLLSGGIDSPVAAYRVMKRGCPVTFVHFHSYPFVEKTSQEKADALAAHLTQFQYASRLYVVPFGEIQREVVLSVPPPYRVVVYRRLMARIAEQVAQKEGALALATGESLGQVASQTLENLVVIEEAVRLPILRPLIGMDKEEIAAAARAIGTFETSIIPDQDCCTLFTPKHPVVRSTVEEIRRVEGRLDLSALVAGGLARAAVQEYAFPPLAAG
jgi:thiamine biosynthesis protein ThiI